MALNLLVYGMMRFVDILMLGYYLPAREGRRIARR